MGWKAKIQAIMDKGPEAGRVPPTFCRIGCGRKVAPGLTNNGNPYSTCCRGCVMGFGHDLRCGTIDESKVGKGLCKNGCGRKVAKGLDAKGRQLDTCCRGCALEGPHDATCGRDMTTV